MIQRKFDPPNSPEWNQWIEDCRAAGKDLAVQESAWEALTKLIKQTAAGQVSQTVIDKLVAEQASQNLIDRAIAGQASEEQITRALARLAPRVRDDLYKRMRQVVFSAFNGKCAYCEAKFVLDQTGDVEHFRPKGAVLDYNANPVHVQLDGMDLCHPGYYWLAYDWRNLLPSCSKCNRMTKTPEGKWIGKGARFPVNGANARAEGEEDGEQPLLIHPVWENPEDYLTFDTATGLLLAKDENARGKACIEILDLNRDGLPEARKDVYDNVLARMYEAFCAAEMGNQALYRKDCDKVYSYKTGTEAYSLPGRLAIEAERDRWRRRMEEMLK